MDPLETLFTLVGTNKHKPVSVSRMMNGCYYQAHRPAGSDVGALSYNGTL